MVAPLEGLRVIDLSDRLSGAFAARLFGDFGADVVLVEPPGGHPLRHEPPFLDDQPGPERSVLHAYANWNKRSVVAAAGADIAGLLAEADVVITTAAPAATGWDAALLDRLRADAVHLSVTAHGLSGPLSGTAGNNLTTSARTGWSFINGYRDEPPLQMPHDQAGYIGGVCGFLAAAAALRRRSHGEQAEKVDVSEMEALALTVHPWAIAAVYEDTGFSYGPAGGRYRGDPGPLWDASDGRMNFGIGDFHNWTASMEVLGLPELGQVPELIPDLGRHSQDLVPVVAGIARTLPALKRWEVFHALAELRSEAGVMQDIADIVRDPQLAARSFLVETTIDGRTVRAAGPPARLMPSPWRLRQAAPVLGSGGSPADIAQQWRQHRMAADAPSTQPGSSDGNHGSVSGGQQPAKGGERTAQGATGASEEVAPSARSMAAGERQTIGPRSGGGAATVRGSVSRSPAAAAEGPLSGVRVLSFTHAWSGTFGTELLALLGADVVQIGAVHRPDVWRRVRGRVPKGLIDPGRTQHPLNTQGLYNSVNLHKREISLDLRHPRGQDIFWKLLPRFDMIAENFRPTVLPSWGITLEKLHALRPGMIWAAISAYGTDGPYWQYAGNGATTEPMSGFSSLLGYEGDRGKSSGGLYPDPVCGYFFAATVLAALAHRDRTGEPQRIDLSMIEAVAAVCGDAVVEYDATGRVPAPRGNHHPRIAPHNNYAAAGGEWLALAAETDAAWQALAAHTGDPRLNDPRFATMAGRKVYEADVDALLSEWCAGRDAAATAAELHRLGITAARVAPFYDLYSRPDPDFLASGFVSRIDHPETGPTWLPGRPWRFSAAPSSPVRPAPCIGQHSREVFAQELGIGDDEYAELVAAGVTGTLDEVGAH